jgi:hypothetical protein
VWAYAVGSGTVTMLTTYTEASGEVLYSAGEQLTAYNLALQAVQLYLIVTLVRNGADGKLYVASFTSTGGQPIILQGPLYATNSTNGPAYGTRLQAGSSGSVNVITPGGDGAVVIPDASFDTGGIMTGGQYAGQTFAGPKRFRCGYYDTNKTQPAAYFATNPAQKGTHYAGENGYWPGSAWCVTADKEGNGSFTASGGYVMPYGLVCRVGATGISGSALLSDIVNPAVLYNRSYHSDSVETPWEDTTDGTNPGGPSGVAVVLDPDRAEFGLMSVYSQGDTAFGGDARVSAATRNRLPSRYVNYEYYGGTEHRREGGYGRLRVTVSGTTYDVFLSTDSYSGMRPPR